MRKNKTKLLVLAGTVVAGFVATLSFNSLGSAENSGQVDWFTRSPSIIKAQDYANVPSTSYENCTTLNIQMEGSSAYNPLCMTQTAMGQMSQLYSNSGFVQPQGWSKAYQIDFRQGGNPIVQPVPNQASGVYFSAGSNDVIYMGLFYQISNHLRLQGFSGSLNYAVSNPTADMMFRHPNGEQVQFRYNSSHVFPFSQNGRYMIAKSSQGFIRINVMDTSIKYFAANPWISGNTPVAIDNSGRYGVYVYNSPSGAASSSFKFTDINSCSATIPSTSSAASPSYADCKTVDYMSTIRQAIPNVQFIYKPQFVNERTVTFVASYRDASSNIKYAQYSLTADGQALSLKRYEAIGDSYISGEGAGSYRQGTDTARNQCHQSLLSYPYSLGASQSSFSSFACSGAKMQHIVQTADRADQLIGAKPTDIEILDSKDNRTPGVVLQGDFIADDNPEAITVSIGGNDIGFAGIVQNCVNPFKQSVGQNIDTHMTCYSSYEDRKELVETIDRHFTKLRELYKDLKDNGTTGRRVYVIGYPQVAKVDGNCGVNVKMNSAEVKFTHDLVEHLNSVIKKAADEAGVLYVDTQSALDGHRLCEASGDQTAINGLTYGRTSYGTLDIKGSFHPNKLGHELLAASIASQTQNLTKPMPGAATQSNAVTTSDQNTIFLGAPKTGRAISQVRPVTDFVGGELAPGQALGFQVGGADYMTKAGNIYKVTIGPNRTTLGSFTADANGNIAVTATIVSGLAPGFQTLAVSGNDMFGNPISLQQTVLVTSGIPGDADGDGLPDASDSCVLAAQSGQDADKDGIDDACDPLISDPPAEPPSEEGIVWWDNAILPITIQSTSTGGP